LLGVRVSLDFLKKYCKYILLFLFACGAFSISYVSTIKGGVNLSRDSANYLCAARTFMRGRGFLCFDNTYFVKWPPLYPFVLSMFLRAGGDIFYGARIFQALLFAGTVLFSGLLFLRNKYSLTSVVLGVSLVCFSLPLYTVSLWLWTEPLFLFLLILFFYVFNEFLNTPGYRNLIFSAVVCSLIWLTKYTGVIAVITGLIFILSDRRLKNPQRITMGLIFGMVASFPLGLWIGRNYVLTHTLAGVRVPSDLGLIENIYRSLNVITSWFCPFSLHLTLRIILFTGTVGGMIYAGRKDRKMRFMFTFGLLYLLFLVFMAVRVHFDKLDTRLLAPVYLPVVSIITAGLNALYYQKGAGRTIFKFLAGFWFLVVIFLVYTIISITLYFHTTGGKFTVDKWRDLEVVKWLKKHPLKGKLYSNAPDVLYLGAGLNASRVPERIWGWKEMEEAIERNQNVYLIWFGIRKGQTIFSLKEIGDKYRLIPIKKFSRALVFKINEKS